MKNFKFLFFYLLLPVSLLAQNSTENIRKLNTQGVGKMKVSPDWVTTNLTATAKGKDYNKVVNDLNAKVTALEKQLVMSGFKKEDLKTSSYHVNKHIVWHEGRSIDSGYIAQHDFTLEFNNDNKIITRLVNGLSNGKIDVSFNFGFGLSDQKQKEVRDEVIKRAVLDAKEKAQIIATTSEIKLKKIIKIDYGQIQNHPPMPYMREAMAMDKSSQEFSGFQTKEMELSDMISITWEIE